MGRAIEVISGFVTNPSTTQTAWTNSTGNSNVVRNFPDANPAYLEDGWGQSAAAGVLRVRSPRLHDNLQGIRMGILAATPQPTWPDELRQLLQPQDALVIDQSGGASEVDCGSLLVAYSNLPGTDARLHTWDEIKPRIVNVLFNETQHTIGGTAGQYGGAAAVNAFEQVLKANTDYALLGYLVSAAVCTVGFQSPDFGNLRIGGPGTTQRIDTRDWFLRRAVKSGEPWIPVFNAANAGSTYVDLLSTATSGAVNVQSVLAQLR